MVPSEEKDKLIFLKFEGVYMGATVYVNGQAAGRNMFGYSTFYVDLTPLLKYNAENLIMVSVRGAMKNSRWYSGAGIYRDVTLLKSDRCRIKEDSVQLTTLEADQEMAVLMLRGQITNQHAQKDVYKRQYMDYFKDLEDYYNVEFMFSESISNAEDELAFAESCASAGCVGYIGGYNCSGETIVDKVTENKMYYWGCERGLDEKYADNEYYLGGFQPVGSDENVDATKGGDYLLGYSMAENLADQGAKHVVYLSLIHILPILDFHRMK